MIIPRGKKGPEETVQFSVLSLAHYLRGSSLSAFSIIYCKWLRRPFGHFCLQFFEVRRIIPVTSLAGMQ